MTKTKTRKIVTTTGAIAVAALLGLTACGGQQAPTTNGEIVTEASSAVVQNGYEGSYSLYAIGTKDALFGAKEYGEMMASFAGAMAGSMEASDTDSSEVAEKADISKSTLEVKSDGTAVMTVFGTAVEATWQEENGEFVLNIAAPDEQSEDMTISEATAKGKLENGVLTLTTDDTEEVMVYTLEGADVSEIETQDLSNAFNASADSISEDAVVEEVVE